MLYVQRMIKNVQGEGYPFSVPALAAAKEIRFTAPITVICGDNGSGKSTLLSLLAAKLGAVRIGQGMIERERAAEQAQETGAQRLMTDGTVVYFEGWVPAGAEEKLAQVDHESKSIDYTAAPVLGFDTGAEEAAAEPPFRNVTSIV